ncbi:hypothetical protein BC833DRAFT_583696 [Globomyces pollinis-pini]|nr:hypothetical protein BC833DRAFT_583696 [Globomyces pollinis-pini]
MSRRDQDYNRRNQSYLTEPYYEHYYSDLDINDHHQSSSNRPMPPSPRHQTINNERYGEFNPARPYTNKKSIGDIWKKLTSKANKTFQKTFKRDSSKLNVMGRESLASLPELSVNQSYNPGHRRIVSVRPLPSPPQFNTNPRPSNHQRRPTGPRELPATLQNVVDQKARFNKVTEYESILHRDFEGLVSLLKLYHNCEDARIEKAIRAKWTDVKVSMHEVDV